MTPTRLPNNPAATQILRKLLHLWHKNGDKVLIFSMSLKILSFLEDLMSQTRYEYLVLAANAPQKRPYVPELLRARERG